MGDLTQARLRELLDYDPGTGVFTWKVRRGGVRYNLIAGSKCPKTGYVYVRIDRCRKLAHRLAFMWVEGRWPTHEIDHRNGVRDDNKWVNLREATHRENSQNIKFRSDNKSGYQGVSWHSASKKWRAFINIGQKFHHLGLFEDPREAHAAYLSSKQRLHTFQPIPRDK